MSAPPKPVASIRDKLGEAPERGDRFLWGPAADVSLARAREGTIFSGCLAELA